MNTLLATLIISATWISHPAMRSTRDYGPVVTDIESHLPAGNVYRESDLVGWVHEGTHGINSLLRNKYKRPGFYVLNDRAFLLNEPDTTLSKVAVRVPPSMQRTSYFFYLVKIQQWWNEQPTYILDEWVAYTNGSEARYKLGITGRRTNPPKLMMEFCVYALVLAQVTNDPSLRDFIKWQVEQSIRIRDKNNDVPTDSLAILRTIPDCEKLREFCRGYFGQQWTRATLGF